MAVERVRGAKGAPWKALENDGKRTIRARNVGIFSPRRDGVKRFRGQAEEEKHAGIQGQWQLESPAREYMEQVKCCSDTDCTHRIMKRGFLALKSGRVGTIQKHFQEWD